MPEFFGNMAGIVIVLLAIVAFIVIGVAALCLVAALLAWSNPGSFRHICTVLAPK